MSVNNPTSAAGTVDTAAIAAVVTAQLALQPAAGTVDGGSSSSTYLIVVDAGGAN